MIKANAVPLNITSNAKMQMFYTLREIEIVKAVQKIEKQERKREREGYTHS